MKKNKVDKKQKLPIDGINNIKKAIILCLFIIILGVAIDYILTTPRDLISNNQLTITDNNNQTINLDKDVLGQYDLSGFIKQYSQFHHGDFGVSLVELSGKLRRASYNEDKIFTSASTYKLFVAYSTLKRVENNTWSWTDKIIDERNLSTCFDDMISKSDNECAEALINKIGYETATDEAHSIGCDNTTFVSSDGYAKTTSADLALFLVKLYKSQILTKQSSRDRLINAMKNNIFREGIPAGIDDLLIDKTGQIDSFINDAAIIYGNKGIYILVIMSDGSSWATIANFAKNIDMIHSL